MFNINVFDDPEKNIARNEMMRNSFKALLEGIGLTNVLFDQYVNAEYMYNVTYQGSSRKALVRTKQGNKVDIYDGSIYITTLTI